MKPLPYKTRRAPCLVAALLTLIFWLHVASAAAGDFRIVPGVRIGNVALGMSRAAVHRVMLKPTRTRVLEHGFVLETWLSRKPVSQDVYEETYLKRNYVAVFFRYNRAVQIEVTSASFVASGGLSTGSGSDSWEKQYPPDRSFVYTWMATDPGAGSPAGKHILDYDDAVQAGIAWKCGAWGDGAPDSGPTPEAIIVHLRGHRVRLNPNDADDYSGTGHRNDPPDPR